MSTGPTLILSLGIISVIAALLYYKVLQNGKQDKADLELLLENLKRSLRNKDVKSIDEYGKQLIFNQHVTNKHLEELRITLEQSFGGNESLSELQNLIYNKQLHWKTRRL